MMTELMFLRVLPNNSLCDPFARNHALRFVRLKRGG
jgi:hypothetical protein